MGSEESIRGEASRPVSGVLTFLFADVRGPAGIIVALAEQLS